MGGRLGKWDERVGGERLSWQVGLRRWVDSGVCVMSVCVCVCVDRVLCDHGALSNRVCHGAYLCISKRMRPL